MRPARRSHAPSSSSSTPSQCSRETGCRCADGRQRRLEVALRDVADAAGGPEPADLDVGVQVGAHRDELLLDGRVLGLIAEEGLAKVAAEPERSGIGASPRGSPP